MVLLKREGEDSACLEVLPVTEFTPASIPEGDPPAPRTEEVLVYRLLVLVVCEGSRLSSVLVLAFCEAPEIVPSRAGLPPPSTPEMDPGLPAVPTPDIPGWALFSGDWLLLMAVVPDLRAPAFP